MSLIPTTNHPLYATWATLHRRHGAVPEWAHFDEFISSVKARPTKEKSVLMKRDAYAPIGPDNHIWVPAEEHARLYRNAKWLWYGNRLLRIVDWAYVFGVSAAYVGRIVANGEADQLSVLDRLVPRNPTPQEREAMRDRLNECLARNSPAKGVIVRTINAAPTSPAHLRI